MTDLMRYKIDRFKIWLRDIIAYYLEKKVEEAPGRTISFKKYLECDVWLLDNNWDHDCRNIKVLGLSCITRCGFVRPKDIDKLEDIIKILFKVLFFGTRR